MSSISGAAASAAVQQAAHARRGGGPQGLRDQLKQFASASGVEGASYAKLQQQVDEAAKAAAESGGNPRESVKAAVSQVLKDNGLDPAAFDVQLKKNRSQGRPEGGPPPGGKPHGHGGPGGPSGARQGALTRLLEARKQDDASGSTATADEDDALESQRGFLQTGTLVDTQA